MRAETWTVFPGKADKVDVGNIAGADLWVALLDARAIFDLDLSGNVRVAKTNSRAREAMQETATETPELFPFLHNGVCITATALSKASGGFQLKGAQLVNGAQTQKALSEMNLGSVKVVARIIVSEDEDFSTEVSIASNRQDFVQEVSIYGGQGDLDSLELEMRKAYPGFRIQKSETDVGKTPAQPVLQRLLAWEGRAAAGSSAFRLYAERLAKSDIDKTAPLVQELSQHILNSSAYEPIRTRMDNRTKGFVIPALYIYGRVANTMKPDKKLDKAINALLVYFFDSGKDGHRMASLTKPFRTMADMWAGLDSWRQSNEK